MCFGAIVAPQVMGREKEMVGIVGTVVTRIHLETPQEHLFDFCFHRGEVSFIQRERIGPRVFDNALAGVPILHLVENRFTRRASRMCFQFARNRFFAVERAVNIMGNDLFDPEVPDAVNGCFREAGHQATIGGAVDRKNITVVFQ